MNSNVATQWTAAKSRLLLAMTIEPREIGQRIKAAREAKLWTQLQFAAEANVSPSTVARWEAGKLPPVRELVRISGVLGIAPDELVGEAQPGTSNQRLDRLESQAEETRRILVGIAHALGVEVPDDEAPSRGDGQAL